MNRTLLMVLSLVKKLCLALTVWSKRSVASLWMAAC